MDFNVVIGILGGLGLFVYGMHLLSDALKKLSLGFLKKALEKVTSNRVKALLAGAFLTSIIQSSSATSVILIGFLNAGILTLTKAVPVIIGANIGTTITAQLIAFKLTKAAPLFVFFGALIFFASKKNKHKNKGLAILGFGLLFLGLATMTSAVKPLAEDQSVRNMFVVFSANPLLGILVGVIITVLLQSSSTTLGIVIALASVGLIDLPAAIFLVLGDNIGTCITAIIASLGSNLAGKRLALGHTLFNIIGTAIAFPLVPFYLYYIPMLSGDIARQIAHTHTIFNIVNATIFLPFIPLYIRALNRIIPGEDYTKKEVRFLERKLLATPDVAITAVTKELGAMIGLSQEMLNKSRICIESYDHKLGQEIGVDEDSVDEMQKNITEYMVEITKREISEKNSRLIPALLHSVNDVERVADYCEGMTKVAQRMYENNLRFSKHAKDELNRLIDMTKELMELTKKAVEEDSRDAASKTIDLNLEINKLTTEYRLNHVKRLEENRCDGNAGLVYTDILIFVERINAHLCNITKGILHIGKR